MSHSEFTYNASALGVGGTYLRETADGGTRKVIVPSLASVALSPSGGEGSSVVEGYDCNGVSFSRAESRVVGYSRNRNEYVTYSDIFITDLNVLGRLTVALMHATVVSTHDINEPESKFELQATYRNVELDGEEVLPVLDVDLTQNCPTYSKFSDHVSKSLPSYADRFGINQRVLRETLERPDNPQLRASLTREIEFRDKATRERFVGERKAYGLEVPGLGKANFAEFQVKPGRRRITLLRFDVEPQLPWERAKELPKGKFIPRRKLIRRRSMASTATGDLATGEAPPPEPETETEAFDLRSFGDLSIASVDGNGSPPWKP